MDVNEEGQSVLEFLIMLPVMIGLTLLMLRVNMAIQTSIVNQQYSRAQALFLTFNSPIYPELRLRVSDFHPYGANQMVIGVSENSATRSATAGIYRPQASEQVVARKNQGGSSEARTEPKERSRVRIRTTVSLCTQPNVVFDGSKYSPINDVLRAPDGTYISQNSYIKTLNEGTNGPAFTYCRGAI